VSCLSNDNFLHLQNKARPGGQNVLRSSTPTEELEQLTNGFVEHGYNGIYMLFVKFVLDLSWVSYC
jgi:hypothetical protein